MTRRFAEPRLDLYSFLYIRSCRREMMDVLSYSDTRDRLKGVMDRVVDDHAPVVVTRARGEFGGDGLVGRLEHDGRDPSFAFYARERASAL